MTQPTSSSARHRRLHVAVRFGVAVLLVLSALGLDATPARVAYANSLIVNTTSDSSFTGDGLCSLRSAIQNANADLDLSGGDCPPGSGADTITFSVTGIISLTQVPDTLTHALPTITTDITLTGPGAANLTIRVHANSVGVFAVGPGGVFTLSGLTVADGLTTGSGGGIFNDGGIVTVADTIFANNRALMNGGGIYSANGSLTVARSTFSDNNTDGSGGGIYNLSGFSISNSTFSNNQADGNGGAIYAGGDLSVISSTFSGNSAGNNGGGIHSGALIITNSTFSSNSASGNGGGIYTFSNSTLTVIDSVFSGNSAGGGGGGIYSEEGSQMDVTDSTFTGNSAIGGGGGIANVDGTLVVTASTFSSNNASGGGAIDGGVGSNTVISSTLASNNAALGGGLSAFSGLSVTDSTLSSNSATLDGGGVYIGTDTGFALINSTLSSNSASRNGGGLYNTAGGFGGSLTHVTFYGNGASSGGAIYNDSVVLSLANTLIAYSTSGGNCAGAASAQDNGRNLQTGSLSCGNTIPSHASTPTFCSLLDPLHSNGGPTKTHALVQNQPDPPCPPGGNPAIDTVPLIDCAIPADQRGVARPQDTACDIGAFEFGPLPPVAVSDTATTSANTPVTINVLANDHDPNPTDILTVTMVTSPVNGMAVISGTTQVTYTPNPNFSGQDVFTYTVSDGILASTAAVTVTVLSKLYLPIIRR